MIDLINSRTESQTTMEYNAQGRLSKITVDTFTNGVKSKSVTQEYVYNSSGMKISQVESVDANADGVIDGQSITSYLNEALNHTGYAQVLEERKIENGQPVKVTTYTIGYDVLAQFDSVNGYLALMADGHGSTRGVTNSLGQMVQQYSYVAYGNAIGFDPAGAYTNLLYSGEQFNPVSGLQYLRARWYNPTNGCFNRLDPYFGNHESPLSFHKYAYAHMNPILGIDPSGLSFAMTLPLIEFSISSAIYGILAQIGVGVLVGAGVGTVVGLLLQSRVMQVFMTAVATSAVAGGQVLDPGENIMLPIMLLAIHYALSKYAPPDDIDIFPVIAHKYPTVYSHHIDAIKDGRTTLLTYNGAGPDGQKQTRANRRAAIAAAKAQGIVTATVERLWIDLDEYPYASTNEGGAKSHVSKVYWLDNAKHGGQLGAFYVLFLRLAPKLFFVMPVNTLDPKNP